MQDFSLGQLWQRLAAAGLAVSVGWFYLKWTGDGWSAWFLIASSVAFFLFFLMSIPRLYRAWMVFAEWLSTWIMRMVLSVVYFVMLPILTIFSQKDRLGQTRHRNIETLWINKKTRDNNLDDMRRMG